MGADDLFGAGEDLVEGHGGGVEDDGVGSGLERGFGAVAVAVVAVFQFSDDGFFGEALLVGSEGIGGLAVGILVGLGVAGERFGDGLTIASVAADLGGGVEKDFDFGVGEDGGADVAAFHDDAAVLTQRALLLDHPRTNARMNADAGGGFGHIFLAHTV